MGLWHDFWGTIGNWFRDGVSWLVEGAVWLMDRLKKGYLTGKHIVGEWLSDALDTTLGSIAVLLLLVGGAIALVFFGSAIAASGFVATLKAARNKVITSLQIVAEAIKLKFILDVNKLLMAVWSDYRDIFQDLNTAFIGLASELGYDASTILLMTNLGKSVAINSLQFVGMDSKAAEIEAMLATQEFLEKVDDKFFEYAADPGKFVAAFDAAILQPYREEGNKGISALYGWLDTMRTEVTEHAANLWQVRQDLQGFQEALGPEIAAKFDAALGVYFDHFDNFYLDSFMPILDKVNIGFDTINEMQERNERKLEALEDSQNDPLANLDNLLKEGIDEQRKYFGIYWDGLAFAVDEGKPELNKLHQGLNGGLAKIRDANRFVPPSLPFLELEDLRPVKPSGPETYPGDGWNMGDY